MARSTRLRVSGVMWSLILASLLLRQFAGVVSVSEQQGGRAAELIGKSGSKGDVVIEGIGKNYHGSDNATDSSMISWEGVEAMDTFINRFWKGNYFCETMLARNETQNNRPTLLKVTFGCQDLFRKSSLGTGNFISAFYGLRMAARVLGNVNVVLECPDAFEQRTKLILPWLMGSFLGGASSLVSDQVGIYSASIEGGVPVDLPTREEACSSFEYCPIGHILPIIRYELRRMAIALVGVPVSIHPSASFAERYLWNDSNDDAFAKNRMQLPVPARDDPPLIPNVELDDTVVHFRCGDLMASSHPGFGFMKFSAFSKRISPEVRSIGIVTQPFDKDGHQYREKDSVSGKQERCRVVVTALVEFLQERFPAARITVHNGPDETIALAFARMIMANQTMAGITTFGVFPAVASFGTGYIRKPNFYRAPNQWLTKPPHVDQLVDNLVLMKEPNRLMAGKLRKMWELESGQESVLEWFRNDTICIRKPCQ